MKIKLKQQQQTHTKKSQTKKVDKLKNKSPSFIFSMWNWLLQVPVPYLALLDALQRQIVLSWLRIHLLFVCLFYLKQWTISFFNIFLPSEPKWIHQKISSYGKTSLSVVFVSPSRESKWKIPLSSACFEKKHFKFNTTILWGKTKNQNKHILLYWIILFHCLNLSILLRMGQNTITLLIFKESLLPIWIDPHRSNWQYVSVLHVPKYSAFSVTV